MGPSAVIFSDVLQMEGGEMRVALQKAAGQLDPGIVKRKKDGARREGRSIPTKPPKLFHLKGLSVVAVQVAAVAGIVEGVNAGHDVKGGTTHADSADGKLETPLAPVEPLAPLFSSMKGKATVIKKTEVAVIMQAQPSSASPGENIGEHLAFGGEEDHGCGKQQREPQIPKPRHIIEESTVIIQAIGIGEPAGRLASRGKYDGKREDGRTSSDARRPRGPRPVPPIGERNGLERELETQGE